MKLESHSVEETSRATGQSLSLVKVDTHRGLRRLASIIKATHDAEALLLLVLGAIEVAAFVGMRFMRPDVPVVMEIPSVWWKLASTGLIAILGAGIALMSADPVRSPRRGVRTCHGTLLSCLECFVFVFACPSGDPLYIAVWWAVGCSIVTVLGRAALLRFSRW